MSKINTDAVEPSTGTSLVLGASGDTVSIPAGATIANSGTATGFGGGKVLQAVMGTSSTGVDQTAVAFIDTGLTVTITPSATSSKILVLANHAVIATQGSTSVHLELFRDSTSIADWGNGWLAYSGTSYVGGGGTFTYLDSPSSTSAIVYKTQFKCESAAGGNVAKVMAGNTDGSIIALEIGT